jgi:hypothetical protein
VIAVALASGSPAASSERPIITVTRFNDPIPSVCTPSSCSLREAVILANSIPGQDIIYLPDGIYDLKLGRGYFGEDEGYDADIDITDDVLIVGDGEATVITDTTTLPERALDIHDGINVSISDLTIRDLPGFAVPYFDCGRAVRTSGALTLVRVTIMNNFMRGDGGGICNQGGELKVIDSVISGNCACMFGFGGGIYSSGTLHVERSAITGNRADVRDGGGIASFGSATVVDSVIADNSTTAPFGERRGGGLFAGAVVLTNVTISGNRTTAEGSVFPDVTDARGGGAWISGGTLTNVTVFNNESGTTAGGIFYNGHGELTLLNTIIAGNTGGDCEGAAPISAGHNIDGDGSCGLDGPGDMPATDPLLAPLAGNGGPTATHALLPGSPARDAGGLDACPEADQRGAPRPAGPACDIGAFEADSLPPEPPPPPPQPAPPPVLAGDAGCDSIVDAVDALHVLRAVAALPPHPGCLLGANLDCNLVLDAVDGLLILRYVAGMAASSPAGCPRPGEFW